MTLLVVLSVCLQIILNIEKSRFCDYIVSACTMGPVVYFFNGRTCYISKQNHKVAFIAEQKSPNLRRTFCTRECQTLILGAGAQLKNLGSLSPSWTQGFLSYHSFLMTLQGK